eukprot:60334-Chlamydomonas_euryale.AAC.1
MPRSVAKVPQRAATMGVLVQELHCPKVSFVLHTARPSDMDESVMLVRGSIPNAGGGGKGRWRHGRACHA